MISVGERLKADATRRKKGRKKTKHSDHGRPLPVSVYTCAHKGLYKGATQPTPKYKYPRCYW